MKSSEYNFPPVGLNAIAEVELVLLGRKRNWFKEVGHSFSILKEFPGCFAMLDGQMALISSTRLDYVSLVNLQQINEIENNTKDDKLNRSGDFDNIISVDGSIVYQINGDNKKYKSKLNVVRRQTNECCNIIVNSHVSSLVPVKDGVLLLRQNEIPELWNPGMSNCLECFRQLAGTTYIFPISNDLVACEARSKVDILNIFNRNIVSTSSKPDGSQVVACNSKYKVLIYDIYSKVMSLLKNSAILWQCCDPRLCSNSPICPCASFPAQGDKIIVYGTFIRGLHILEASTGNYLRGHRLKDVHSDIVNCRFLLVNGIELLIYACKNNFLYLINALSGELLTYLDVGSPPSSLSVCLERSVVAVGFRCSKDFKLIKVWTTNGREDKRQRRIKGGATGAWAPGPPHLGAPHILEYFI